jgi:hypothetical protein
VPSIFGLLLAGLFGFLIALILKKSAELELLLEKQAANLSDYEIKFKSILTRLPWGCPILIPAVITF